MQFLLFDAISYFKYSNQLKLLRLCELSLNPLIITFTVRHSLVTHFQTSSSCRVALLSITAAGTGESSYFVPLHSIPSLLSFLSLCTLNPFLASSLLLPLLTPALSLSLSVFLRDTSPSCILISLTFITSVRLSLLSFPHSPPQIGRAHV